MVLQVHTSGNNRASFGKGMHRLYLCMLLCLLPLHTSALALSPKLSYIEYQEKSQNEASLNVEAGWISGLAGRHGWSTSAIDVDVFTELLFGRVDYEGQTQSGLPHQTNSIHTHGKLGFKVSSDYLDYPLLASSSLQPFFEMSYQYWLRDIQASNGIASLTETYSWQTIAVGILANMGTHDVIMNVGKNIQANVRVHETSCFESFTVHPNNGDYISIQYQYRFTENLKLGASYSRSHLGRSPDTEVNTCLGRLEFHEPASLTQRISASLIWQFALSE